MERQDMQAIHEKAAADGFVKVGLPMDNSESCEWCFARRISPTHAKIDNVPVACAAVNYGDVVEFREQDPPHVLFKEYVRVKTRGSQTFVFRFAPQKLLGTLTPDELKARAGRMREHLNSGPESIKPLALERVSEAWMAGAWPLTAKASKVARYVRRFKG